MKRFYIFALIAGLVLAVGTAQALTLHPSSSTAEWYDDWTANKNGDPYWDGDSGDAIDKNIGQWLESSSYGKLPTWAVKSTGAADPEVTFTNGSEWAAIVIEVAGLSSRNYFGYYDANTGVKYQLFSGAQGPSAKIVFHAPPLFGFYLETKDSLGNTMWTWYTESSKNTYDGQSRDTTEQHFAFFQAPPKVPGLNAYIIGVEDLPIGFSDTKWGWGEADKDYQDFVVYVANIPDASTFALFLSGLPALALLRRRRG